MASKKKANDSANDATEAVATDGPEFLKKISAKNVMGGKVEKPTKATELYTLIGVVDGIKTGSTDYGEYIKFLGQFKAIRSADRQEYFATAAFLPNPAQEMLVSAIESAQANDPQASIEIAYVIGVKPADNAVGYEYTVKPLLSQKADALAALESRIAAKVPALAAPK